METEMDAKSVCRLCHKNSANMFSIFQKNVNGVQILNIIKECLPNIIIYRRDPLSKMICFDCNENIALIYNFKKVAFDVIKLQKDELLFKLNDSKVQLYLDILENQSNDLESCDSYKQFIDTSTLTDNSFNAHDNVEFKTDFQLEMDTNHSDLLSEANSYSYVDKTFNGFDENATESDMDICDVNDISSNDIMVTISKKRKRVPHKFKYFGPQIKKRRIIGPKSKQKPNPRIKITKTTSYSPNSLLKYAIDAINKQNIEDFTTDTSIKVEKEIEEAIHLCNHCKAIFETENELALHEMNTHMKLDIEPVDVLEFWDNDEPNADLRNAWLEENYEIPEVATTPTIEMESESIGVVDNGSELEDLLMPMEEVATEEEEVEEDVTSTFKDRVQYVNGEPTVDGVLLSDLSRADKHDLFTSVKFNGLKRKFCSLCRHTFKDNWAIEGHYQSKSCLYTCQYCGLKLNKQRANFDAHILSHVNNGDVKSDRIFVSKNKHNPIPKSLPASVLSTYIPDPNRTRAYMMRIAPKTKTRFSPVIRKKQPKLNQTHIKLEIMEEEAKNIMPATSKPENQAYCCRKCFEVFSKLDAYNVHINICSGVVEDPSARYVKHYNKSNKQRLKESDFYRSAEVDVKPIIDSPIVKERSQFSPTGRPIRHCVKEVVTYDDEAEPEKAPDSPQPAKGRHECGLCSSVFPTMHSRNSHMRIHKAGFKMAASTSSSMLRKNDTTITRRYAIVNDSADKQQYVNQYVHQDTMEPIVEIHEGPSTKIPTSIGSVSITPVMKNNKSNVVSPAIMKLVQNNPNITIKTRRETQRTSSGSSNSPVIPPPAPSPPLDLDKCYRCSSCSKPFANKSNLYFHKKNQCVGSKYPCPFCKKRFGTEAAYSSHIFYSHPV